MGLVSKSLPCISSVSEHTANGPYITQKINALVALLYQVIIFLNNFKYYYLNKATST